MPSRRSLRSALRDAAGVAIGVGVLAAGTLTACTSTVSGSPARLGAPVAGTPRPSPIAFNDCTATLLNAGVPVPKPLKGTVRFGCGQLTVPLDYRHPDGASINLSVIRIHSTLNTTTPVQSLLVNPGGPGGGGLDFGLGLLGQMSPAVTRHFDIVAFDPRGVGQSAPVQCLTNAQKDRFLAASPNTTTRAGILAEERQTRQFSSGCADHVGSGLQFYNTVSTARDMDQLRQAVGDDVMNYLGFSYGTELGWTYAHLFPQLVHTFVLDGAVDPTQVHKENSTVQLKGFESAFGQFAAWCKSAPACSRLPDPTRAVEQIYAAARRAPLSTGSSRRLTESLASTGVIEALYSRSSWPHLADALTAAQHGDGAGLLQLADRYNQRQADGSYANIIDANITISCNDSPARKPPAVSTILRRSQALARRFPLFGSDVGGGPGCLGWQPHRTPVPPPSAPTPKPVLVVGNLHDPATPYQGAVNLTTALGNAGLLSWNGEGHTSYLSGSSCVDHYVNDYLIHGTMPPDHTVCPAK
ncbi:MAG TPA: alpha/beta hydrolase [Jatrophihabitans sp.]